MLGFNEGGKMNLSFTFWVFTLYVYRLAFQVAAFR